MFRITIITLILVGITVVLIGCGKKAPPVPRHQKLSAIATPPLLVESSFGRELKAERQAVLALAFSA